MKRSLRQNLCVLAALILGASLLVTDYVDARGGGGGGSRGGGGGSRGGGGASPRVNRSVNTQNRGNFSNRSQPSRDFSGRQGERQTNQQTRQGERQTSQQNRQGERSERQGERQNTQQERQGERGERQGERQGERTERTDTRQGERGERQGERQQQVSGRNALAARDRQQNRQDFINDNNNGYWRGGGWYGGGYYVPPGWGWVGFTTGLVIGSAITSLPPYYNTVYVGSTSYIYSDGIYLQPSGSSYTVVAPPIGAVVTYLPDGCTTIETDNTLYYNCSGIYYQPFFQNGSTVYRVVRF